MEEEFTPFVRESLEDLSQGTLQYFQRHCDISELEQQLQGQAAVLPESQRAPFEDKAAKTVFSLRRAANGAVPQEEHTDQTEQLSLIHISPIGNSKTLRSATTFPSVRLRKKIFSGV